MKDEALGYFDPRPWHKDHPQRPKVWPRGEGSLYVWGPPPTPDFRRADARCAHRRRNDRHQSDAGLRAVRPHPGAARRLGQAGGHQSHVSHAGAGRDFLPDDQLPGVRSLRDVDHQLHHAGQPRRVAVRRHSGVSVARVPPRLFLHQHRQGHQDAGRPQGQARRRGGVPPDRRRLHARDSAARVRRQAERRRMGAGAARPARPQAAATT